jgi:hypothetical protein
VNEAQELIASRKSTGRLFLFPETALVTGASGGSGARSWRSRAEGAEVQGLDLVDGFDISHPQPGSTSRLPTSSA